MQLAKESLMEALVIDVKNYEAFRELIEGGMMSSAEGELLDLHSSRRVLLTELILTCRMGICPDSGVSEASLGRGGHLRTANVYHQTKEGQQKNFHGRDVCNDEGIDN